MISNFTRLYNRKKAGTISGPAQVYGQNIPDTLLNQRFIRRVSAEFCATLRESNGNGGKEWCKNRVAAAEALS